jgi:hypothetical protein
MATTKTTRKKTATKKKATKGKGKPEAKFICKVTPRATAAGHRLATEGHSPSGRTLATTAKKEKAERMRRGCVNGIFKLSAAQKKKLSPAMQKGIIARQRRLGKKIVK